MFVINRFVIRIAVGSSKLEVLLLMQVHLRVAELQRLLDFLKSVNEGREVRNVLGYHFDLRSLKGRLDLDKVAVVGHSFGASTAVAAVGAGDPRFK